MDLTTIVEEIENIRDQPDCKNIIDAKHFVPEAALFAVLSKGNIKCCLQGLGVSRHESIGLAENILNGARKCFAILLLINRGLNITDFFTHDEMQKSTPDDRLPYTREALQRIFPHGISSSTRIITKFLERQWEFAIPVLREDLIFREFQPDVILPYVAKTHVGGGSMGTAWEVGLHPQCHNLPLDGHKVLVKEIHRSLTEDKSVFKKELENLSLLTHLKHPNIVRLYCSYILRDTCNLVFSIADGGSLAQMLDGLGTQPLKALDDVQLLLGLADLASAIHAMHNFTSTALPDLHLTGCHHDLAPRNILVHGTTLLLADFGLSSFRAPEMDSLTMFKDVSGCYMAPECQAPDGNGHFQSQNIGRASDMWSFGCILAEVLTFMTSGTLGVREFRKSRSIKVLPTVEWCRFHMGPGKSNPRVSAWLVSLSQGNKDAGRVFLEPMLRLIRRILSINTSQRPRSAYILSALRGISILSLASLADKAWDEFEPSVPGINHALHKTRFRGWLHSFHQLFDDTIEKDLELSDAAVDFAQTVKALQELLGIMKDSSSSEQKQPLLRYQTARLLAALPSSYRAAAKEYLVRQIMQDDNLNWLERMTGSTQRTMQEDIGVLAAVKHLTVLSEKGLLIEDSEVKKLVMDEKDIKILSEVDLHSLAAVESTSEQVLIEWLDYKEEWADEKFGPELRHRAGSVVALLNSADVARAFGSLHCKGIIHAPWRRAFGLLYTLPFQADPVTLHHLFGEKDPRTKDKRFRPLFEIRFQLARRICQSTFALHNTGWVHRNLHTKNIIFFPGRDVKDEQVARDPYISGLGASRESRPDTFTVGADEARELRKYQHPKYLKGERFCEAFDYYSIGIILLEIGLWDTVSEMTSSKHTGRFQGLEDEDFRKMIVKSRVPKLGITMGSRYMEATRACLDGTLDVAASADCREMFKLKVMDILQSFM